MNTTRIKLQIISVLFLLTYNQSTLNAQNELNLFKNGETNTYKSDGESKSKGLKFQIKYPKNWTVREADRPNIVKMFISQDREIQVSIYVYKLKVQPSDEEKELLLSSEGIQYLLSNDNYQTEIIKIIPNQRIDGEEGTGVIYKMTIRRLDTIAKNKSLNYLIIYKDFQIMLAFGVTTLDIDKDIDKIYQEYESLFKQIASSFVIISKYE